MEEFKKLAKYVRGAYDEDEAFQVSSSPPSFAAYRSVIKIRGVGCAKHERLGPGHDDRTWRRSFRRSQGTNSKENLTGFITYVSYTSCVPFRNPY